MRPGLLLFGTLAAALFAGCHSDPAGEAAKELPPLPAPAVETGRPTYLLRIVRIAYKPAKGRGAVAKQDVESRFDLTRPEFLMAGFLKEDPGATFFALPPVPVVEGTQLISIVKGRVSVLRTGKGADGNVIRAPYEVDGDASGAVLTISADRQTGHPVELGLKGSLPDVRPPDGYPAPEITHSSYGSRCEEPLPWETVTGNFALEPNGRPEIIESPDADTGRILTVVQLFAPAGRRR